MNKTDLFYTILIYYFCVILVTKVISFIINIKFPIYSEVVFSEQSIFWQTLVKIRYIYTLLLLLFKIFLLSYFKANTYITVILSLLIIQNMLYFLIDERYIYYIIPKKDIDLKVLNFIDKYGDVTIYLITFLYAFYVIIKIYS